MTKVALKGDALGTGSITLSAPNTVGDIELELPVTGTHLASAQADGMPLGPDGDPVVESGSNSDGEWTRWADGTQIVTGSVASGTSALDVFPLAFVDQRARISMTVLEDNDLPRATKLRDKTASNFRHTTTNPDGVAIGGQTILYTATGRWK